MSELGPGSISACIVARNEEALIDRCLDSLDGVVDEVVLVHSGPCEDRTIEIAHTCGATPIARGGFTVNLCRVGPVVTVSHSLNAG